jgi:hypothetical protein
MSAPDDVQGKISRKTFGSEIAERTRFYPLRAKGMDTPFVEGLTGYMRRLAAAHRVTVADLICDSHFDNLFANPGDRRTRKHAFLASGYLLDGANDYTQKWIEALEAATGLRDLGSLTLSPFAGISFRSWLRRKRAWCPRCLSMQVQNNPDEVYEPLLWSIRLVSVCPVDLTPLVQQCPHCRASSTPFAGVAAPGHCGRCGGPLWDNSAANVVLTDRNSTEIYKIWCSVHVALLLGASNEFITPLLPSSIARVLAARFQSILAQSRNDRALAAGCSKRSSYLWAKGLALPRIEALFRLCFNLGLSPLDLFRQVMADSARPGELFNSTQAKVGDDTTHQLMLHFPIRKLNGRIHYDPAKRNGQIKSALEKALSQMPPPTLHATAALLKMSSSTALRKLEPDLCKQVAERRKQWEANERSRIDATFRLALSEPSLSSSFERYCFQSGFSMSLIARELPELKASYIAKYRAIKLAHRRARADENRKEVDQLVEMICRQGEYPSVGRIKAESRQLHSLGWDEIQAYIRNSFTPGSL